MQPSRLSRRAFLKASASAGICTGSGMALTSDVDAGTNNEDTPLIVGHRGAGGIEPDNTIRSINRALEYDVDGVEVDVQKTSDGELILFHDPVLDISTNGHGFVDETPYSEIQDLTIHGEPIAHLDEALDLFESTDVQIFLEVKSDGITDKILDKLAARNLEHRTTFVSFEAHHVKAAADAPVNTGLLGKFPNPFLCDDAVEAGCGSALVHYVPEAVPQFTDKARELGLSPGVWSLVDTEWSIRDALEADLDVITTNRPDLAVPIRDGKPPSDAF